MSAAGNNKQSSLVGVFIRGLAMGAADVVPGVSGGTIALITGIYDRLLSALAGANLPTLRLLLRGQFGAVWRQLDGAFLLSLLLGIATAVLTLAGLIHWLITHYPLPLWSFFFGLVLASAVFLLVEELPSCRPLEWSLVAVGAGLALTLGLAPAGQFITGSMGFFLAGALAICAMILPGISGSFILLLIGMYEPVIAAVNGRELPTLLIFVAGCSVGLLSFTHLLHWILERARRRLMALLAGFLFGSLIILWPWQEVLSVVMDRHGEPRPVQTSPVSPFWYAENIDDSQLLLCLVSAMVGLLLVALAHRAGGGDDTRRGASGRGEHVQPGLRPEAGTGSDRARSETSSGEAG